MESFPHHESHTSKGNPPGARSGQDKGQNAGIGKSSTCGSYLCAGGYIPGTQNPELLYTHTLLSCSAQASEIDHHSSRKRQKDSWKSQNRTGKGLVLGETEMQTNHYLWRKQTGRKSPLYVSSPNQACLYRLPIRVPFIFSHTS